MIETKSLKGEPILSPRFLRFWLFIQVVTGLHLGTSYPILYFTAIILANISLKFSR
jgi:hypothetical protein